MDTQPIKEIIVIYNVFYCIRLIVIALIIYFIFATCIIPLVKAVAKILRKKKLKISEFDDFEKIKQEEFEREQLENEWEFIEEVYTKKYKNNKEKIRKHVNSIKIIDGLDVDENEVIDGAKVQKILETNQSFDVDLFKKWASNIFEYIQLGNISELKLIKSSLSEVLFDKRVLQIRKFEKDNLEIIREDLLVKDVKIYDYYYGNGREEIKVYIKADLKEYIINKKNQRVIRGNRKWISEKQYVLTFQKIETDELEGFIGNCSNCGGTIAENEFCRCKYCGSLVNPIRYNWSLINFESI